jgi:hypothetical protein
MLHTDLWRLKDGKLIEDWDKLTWRRRLAWTRASHRPIFDNIVQGGKSGIDKGSQILANLR